MASADQRPSSERKPQTYTRFGRPLLASLVRPFIRPLNRLLRVDERIAAASQQARLEGVRLVANSMAHHINGPLGVVGGYTELLQRTSRTPQELVFLAAMAQASAEITDFVASVGRVQRVVTTSPPAMPDVQILDLARSTQPAPADKP
ncbi:hypothetical protein A2631_00160 [Candidatus Daviesbacteria bacterium RIFCSPHIGHO2_01_FULL_44_29]|uniref:Signal transduction histidine kinase dimerisation/phosphoacceptor domain-containing protein n=1 Tax=Candidatus Daviesbacteria bacterium RIFCSPHIGHO2_02_FULL_43_12 TaxID=1797776 RepID=A0A1F5KHY8_9BACT|nr:MAG: hypothetical protein A2631_00160 [Candidatus Daviesbacteria bacterium RIFCSPHIGHO2_01_FULL_44_29]OGE40553.1 MAG: hypothetical protein A3D25_00335 [Candidatus Daviesbacteria bacterium RIFCSPHIGHO2_02_FULL_43_12]OGE70112.1 MAG: hypothetical protein A3B55_00105 [Candidatus Daviesbacteria bacterium RIFCSPLOWO2_01_FULL_43_15]